MLKKLILYFLFSLVFINCSLSQNTFTNPLKASGPDPWVTIKNGWYYYMNTVVSDTGENELIVWRTKNMARLGTAESKTIFKPAPGMPYSKRLWAPEIHFLKDKWYIYFAADEGENRHHRIWVLENSATDPFGGEWILKGKLSDPGDHWAIDMTVTEYKEKLYAAWSGWQNYNNVEQDIYLAELENPWTMKGERIMISKPDHAWELHGKVPLAWQKNTGEPPFLRINEGPEFLIHNDDLFIVYSANACWLDYNLGLLQYKKGSKIVDRNSWKKFPDPVFKQAPENGVYAPGHNSFFKSPDEKEDWILYHANPGPTDGCGSKRAPYIQKFIWTKNGIPYFGKPVGRKNLPMPSGSQ
ncbi:MAG: glycoside hydrolase family 43 protein [Chitinophagaceae bacterium]|nr:glycoside hydrolase family 43 protein [Chitinophagaceae bacterium]